MGSYLLGWLVKGTPDPGGGLGPIAMILGQSGQGLAPQHCTRGDGSRAVDLGSGTGATSCLRPALFPRPFLCPVLWGGQADPSTGHLA